MTKVREKITGIYKIESPTGKIYIGQSVDIYNRWRQYRQFESTLTQRILFHSFKKHGQSNHSFSIVCELPMDVSPSILCSYEQFFIDQFRAAGYEMMNIRDAGNRGKHSEHTKRLMSEKQKGRKQSPEAILKMSQAKKGKVGPRLGAKLTPEQIERMKGSKGFKHSEETKRKISQNNARHNKGVPASEASKLKNKLAHLGKVMTEEQKIKISNSLKGRPKDKSHNDKVSKALILYHQKRKSLNI
jgi:group I intron endonuclease